MGVIMIYLDTFGASGGVGRVTREILPALATLTPLNVAGCSHVVDSLRPHLPATVGGINLTPGRWDFRRAYYELARRTVRVPLNLSTFLLSCIRRFQPSRTVLVNYPQVMAPPAREFRYSVLIHDLNWRSFPGNFRDPVRIDAWCRGWCLGAEKVFCNSEFTRAEVLEHYRTAPGKTIAAPLAPFPTCGTSSPDLEILGRLGLRPDGFFLFPGVHGLHKGHDILAAALMQAVDTLPVVVTCGRPGDAKAPSAEYAGHLRKLAAEFAVLEARGKLIVLKGLSDAEMATLRQSCRAFVLPSRYEGYGFPLAEALSLGKPVVHSDIPAFREIIARYDVKSTFSFASDIPESLSFALESPIPQPLSGGETSPMNSWTWESCAQTIINHISTH